MELRKNIVNILIFQNNVYTFVSFILRLIFIRFSENYSYSFILNPSKYLIKLFRVIKIMNNIFIYRIKMLGK